LKTLDLKYGGKKIGLNLSEDRVLSVLNGEKLQPLINPEEKIRRVLKYPISSKSVYETFKAGERVAIVVSDRTRNIAASVFLPVIINELNSIGIPDKDIFIIFSCGTHRLHTKKEHIGIVGEDIAKRIELVDHDCGSGTNLVELDTTSRGTKVSVNKMAADADRVILTGAVTYHYFAGYGGGRKAVLPGISSFETIQTNHKMCLGSDKARTGILEGNPVHEDMLEAARMLNPDLIINVILDDSGRISSIFCGDLNEAHLAGCEELDKRSKVRINKKASAVIASAGGGSKDMNFVQSHKAMEMASYALEDKGTLILLAEAGEGLPAKDYMKYVELGSSSAVEGELKREFRIPGHTIFSAFGKAERFRIIWVTKMDKNIVKRLGIIPADNLAEAMNIAGDIGPAYIMPEAYNTFPVTN